MSKSNITWLIILHLLVSMILFIGIFSIIIFSLRNWLRKYKQRDLAVFDKLNAIVSEPMNRFMVAVTFFAKHQFLVPANLILIFYFLFISHLSWYSVKSGSVALSSLLLMFVLKYLFHRKRPLSPLLNAAKGLSFPSGHAIMSVTFYGSLIYYIIQSGWPIWLQVGCVILLVIFILLIGFSRVYLRVHYASDVITGFLVGLVWLVISLGVVNAQMPI